MYSLLLCGLTLISLDQTKYRDDIDYMYITNMLLSDSNES